MFIYFAESKLSAKKKSPKSVAKKTSEINREGSFFSPSKKRKSEETGKNDDENGLSKSSDECSSPPSKKAALAKSKESSSDEEPIDVVSKESLKTDEVKTEKRSKVDAKSEEKKSKGKREAKKRKRIVQPVDSSDDEVHLPVSIFVHYFVKNFVDFIVMKF